MRPPAGAVCRRPECGARFYPGDEACARCGTPYQPPPGVAPGDVLTTRVSDIPEQRVEWLWARRLPFGKLTMLEGQPGTMKSTLCVDIIARATRGLAMPGETRPQCEPIDVVFLPGEDDVADTVRPRLRAAGADLRRVHVLEPRRNEAGRVVPLVLPGDTERVKAALLHTGARLFVAEPISGHLDEAVRTHNESSVKRALTPLANAAQQTRAAVLLGRHWNKNSTERDSVNRGGGSIAFAGICRSVLCAVRHPEHEGRFVLAGVKPNLSAPPPSIAGLQRGGARGAGRAAHPLGAVAGAAVG